MALLQDPEHISEVVIEFGSQLQGPQLKKPLLRPRSTAGRHPCRKSSYQQLPAAESHNNTLRRQINS